MDVIGTTNFKRSLQRDSYSCGARSVFMILQHFGSTLKYSEVKEALGTDEEGTKVKAMIKCLRAHGLRVGHRPDMSFKKLQKALANNAIVLVHLDGDHFGVVHGMSERRVYLADPSIARCVNGSIYTRGFKKRWTDWGLVVTKP
jgi:ABC-type bacteriocin/lantibiotic exporter with double-glycine peptidase domain